MGYYLIGGKRAGKMFKSIVRTPYNKNQLIGKMRRSGCSNTFAKSVKAKSALSLARKAKYKYKYTAGREGRIVGFRLK